MSQVDEGLVHAWIDGQLPPEEAARVEHLVATDPEWSAAAADARGFAAGAARILSALDDVPAVMGSAALQRKPRSARWWRTPMMSAAASVVLVVGVATALWRRGPQPSEAPPVEATSLPHDVAASGGAELPTQRATSSSGSPSAPPAARQTAPPSAPRGSTPSRTTRPGEDVAAASASGSANGTAAAELQQARISKEAAAQGAAAGRGAGVLAPRAAALSELAAKTVADRPAMDSILAGCWEMPDSAFVNDAGIQRERADARVQSTVTLLRFGDPVVTDVLRNAAPPVTAQALRPIAANARVQNAVARRLTDSTFATEWIHNGTPMFVTFSVSGDTLHGTSRTVVGSTGAGSPFAAIRRPCQR